MQNVIYYYTVRPSDIIICNYHNAYDTIGESDAIFF